MRTTAFGFLKFPFFQGSKLVECVLPATVPGCTCTGVVVAYICELGKVHCLRGEGGHESVPVALDGQGVKWFARNQVFHCDASLLQHVKKQGLIPTSWNWNPTVPRKVTDRVRVRCRKNSVREVCPVHMDCWEQEMYSSQSKSGYLWCPTFHHKLKKWKRRRCCYALRVHSPEDTRRDGEARSKSDGGNVHTCWNSTRNIWKHTTSSDKGHKLSQRRHTNRPALPEGDASLFTNTQCVVYVHGPSFQKRTLAMPTFCWRQFPVQKKGSFSVFHGTLPRPAILRQIEKWWIWWFS